MKKWKEGEVPSDPRTQQALFKQEGFLALFCGKEMANFRILKILYYAKGLDTNEVSSVDMVSSMALDSALHIASYFSRLT